MVNGAWDTEAFAIVLQQILVTGEIDASGRHITAVQLTRMIRAAAVHAADPRRRVAKRANFSDARVDGAADFGKVHFEGEAAFSGARFTGRATFSGAQFHGPADFHGAAFGDDAGFGGTWFRDGCDFTGARFDGDADFSETQFLSLDDARFNAARFERKASFETSNFGAGVQFSDARFGGDASLRSARVMQDALFTGAAFSAPVVLGPVHVGRRLDFGRALFDEDAQVKAVASVVSCERTRFVGRADLKLRWADVLLDDALFQQRSWLTGSPSFQGLAETHTTLQDKVTADGLALPMQERPRLVSVREANVSNLSLSNVDLRACRFARAQCLDLLRLESDCEFAGRPGSRRFMRRRMLAEEHHLRWDAAQALSDAQRERREARRVRWHRRRELLFGGRDEEPRRPRTDTRADRHNPWYPPECRPPAWLDRQQPLLAPAAPEISTLYRSLRKALEDSKNEPGAGDFYYGEMEMRRQRQSPARIWRWRRPTAEGAVISCYWLFSGYGLRASRAMAALLLVVALSTAAFHAYGFRDREQPYAARAATPEAIGFPPPAGELLAGWGSFDAWTYSVGTATAIIGTPDAKLTQTGRGLRIMLRILSPLLIGLALLAIRGRVKR